MKMRNIFAAVALFSTAFATPALANDKQRATASGDELQAVQAVIPSILCQSEGAWCDLFTFTRPVHAVKQHDALTEEATQKRMARIRLSHVQSKEDVDLQHALKLQPVYMSPSVVFCATDNVWCFVAPTTQKIDPDGTHL